MKWAEFDVNNRLRYNIKDYVRKKPTWKLEVSPSRMRLSQWINSKTRCYAPFRCTWALPLYEFGRCAVYLIHDRSNFGDEAVHPPTPG
jgi:hypothetical protein